MNRTQPIVIAPRAQAATSSWWTEPRSRDEFRARATQEQTRMQESRLGRTTDRPSKPKAWE